MAVRSGDIDLFDAVDEIAGLARIVKPLSVSEAEQLLPHVKTILASAQDIGVQKVEVHGTELVIRVAESVRDSAREKISQLNIPKWRVE